MTSNAAYPFLSAEWIAAAKDLRAEYEDRIPESQVQVRINVVVNEIPHRDDLHGHIDTSTGSLIIEEGHLDGPELTVTVDYTTARAAFVARDPQTVMQSFLMGKILVDGDVSQFFPLIQNMAPPTGDQATEAEDIAARMSAFTSED